MQVLKLGNLTEVPWKNGGGVTRNIAKGRAGDQFAWTISRADVAQDGPFSDFAGMTRVLTVVSGGTMVLHSATHSIDALMWQPVRFDGALKIRSRLVGGPLTDLNLMFDPMLCEGTVNVRQAAFNALVARPEQGLLAFHVLAGSPQINAARLTTGDTAFIDEHKAALFLDPGDAVLEMRLDYADHKEAIKLCIADL